METFNAKDNKAKQSTYGGAKETQLSEKKNVGEKFGKIESVRVK